MRTSGKKISGSPRFALFGCCSWLFRWVWWCQRKLFTAILQIHLCAFIRRINLQGSFKRCLCLTKSLGQNQCPSHIADISSISWIQVNGLAARLQGVVEHPFLTGTTADALMKRRDLGKSFCSLSVKLKAIPKRAYADKKRSGLVNDGGQIFCRPRQLQQRKQPLLPFILLVQLILNRSHGKNSWR